MNDERFLQFQRSIDDDILEEAAAWRKQKIAWGRYVALAACFCGVIAGVLAWHPWSTAKNTAVMASGAAPAAADTAVAYSVYAEPEEAPAPEPEAAFDMADSDYFRKGGEGTEAFEEAEAAADENYGSVMTFGASAAVPNPVVECTLDELAEMGYEMNLPDGAELVFAAHISDLAEASFVYAGSEYMLRAQKTADGDDISGVYDTVRKAYSWGEEGTDFEMREGSEGIVFSWYSHADGTQWCLFSRDAGPEALLKTAGEIRGAEVPAPEK